MRFRRQLLQLDLMERVIFFLHRHWFIFFHRSLIYLLFLTPPIIIYLIINHYFPLLLENQVIKPFLLLLGSLYLIFVWIAFFHAWIDYYFDLWVITNRQIISVQQVGLFNRLIAKQPLTRIQDVTAECKGLFPTLFNYGDIWVQTAGTKERFVFQNISNPFEVAKKINQLARESLEKLEK